MKRNKIIYWVFTGLFSLGILSAVAMYFMNYTEITLSFESLGFPAYLVYPLAIAKFLGIIAILQKKFPLLKEWAYAGFTFNLLLSALAHFMKNDGETFGPILMLVLMLISYVFEKKMDYKKVK
ncbi:DoxX family protein [Aureivirga marina]|uniref:DoxX family protein n=1 Tax=Aureivirga marina TaxID=1182451 RepID=UPI0018CA214C|nr:DoxX family protein [Aureivirga marina]